jgi:hypothetical protein
VYEETNLHIQPLLPQATYLSDWEHKEAELQETQWRHIIDREPIPILVIIDCREAKIHLSLMYLADTKGLPTPSSEVKGLLMLEEEEIHHLCQEPITLGQYLSRGSKAILNAEFDTGLILEPFAQLRLLSKILRLSSKTKAQIGTM